MTITEKLMVNLNQVSSSEGLNTDEMERRQKKQKNESIAETSEKKTEELDWKPEDCAQPIGRLIKFTGEGLNKKCHYHKFEFHGNQYGLEDSVLLIPEDANQKHYVAIIKDIFVQGKEGYVKLIVQWFYRPEDVDKKYVKHWRFKDPRDLFYSFQQDEVFAESVTQSCLVYFVPEKKQIPNNGESPDFIVKNIYNADKKKLWKFTHDDLNDQQKHEIGFLLAQTISRVGDFLDIKDEKKTLKSMSKQSVPKRLIKEVEVRRPESSNVVNAPDYKAILEKFDMLTGDTNRDKRLEELLEAVKDKCERKQGSDCDFSWPDDVVDVVRALEKSLYYSLARDIPKYNLKLEMLVDILKNSRMLAKRFLDGELQPEEVLTMTRYGLTVMSRIHTLSSHTSDTKEWSHGITTVIREPTTTKTEKPSTSKRVGRWFFPDH